MRLLQTLLHGGKRYQHWADNWVRSGWHVQRNAATGESRVLTPEGRVKLLGNAEDCARGARLWAPRTGQPKAVVLLHGMGRTAGSFNRLEREFKAQGYATANVAYASLSAPVEQHLEDLGAIVGTLAADGATEISFVGHSFGGMLVRLLLACKLPVPAGRALLLGTPNQGSRFGQRLAALPIYQAAFGASGQAVLPAAAANLPPPPTAMAIIAGGNGKRGYNPFLPGDNDGIVMVEEARLPGVPLAILPCLHTFMPSNTAVRRLALAYITTGRFPS